MEKLDELSASICEIRSTTPEEAERIWNEFFPRLIGFARKKISDMRQRTFDEEDIALSAMNSFFKGYQAGKFEDLSGDDEIWRLLATIAARKATAQRRRLLAEKRSGERGESVFVSPDDGMMNEGLAQIMDERNLPESSEAFAKVCEDMLNLLGDEKLKETALLRMEGYKNREIADRLGCSVARTKQRLTKIREIWSTSD